MSSLTFGEVDWNTGDVPSGGGASDFLRMDEAGDYRVRVMGNPLQYYVNWVDLPGDKKNKFVSPIDNSAVMRELENEGSKPQTRWMLVVLDRRSDDLAQQQFKLLEVGSQIYKGIKELYNKPKWGKVTDYDIVITRGKKGDNPLYRVTPEPKDALEGQFQAKFREFRERVDPAKFMQPASVEKVCEVMGWNASKFGAKAESKKPAESEESEATGGEEGFNFDFKFESA